MKKLVTMIAVIAIAGAASAASFLWSSGANYLVNASGDNATSLDGIGGSIILVYLGNGAAADWNSAQAVTWGNSGQSGLLATAKGAARVYNTFYFTYADGDVANGQWYGVAFQETAGDIYQLQYYGSKTPVSTAMQIAGFTDDGWSGPDFAFVPEGNFEIVPEPTSMALLALGLAALGLRRKSRA